MTIEVISANTIKVALDEFDMADYNVTFDDLDRKSPETKSLLIDLLNSIKQEKNIDLSAERIFVEAFPKDDGGCLLYLSMLGSATKQPLKKASLYNSIICRILGPDELVEISCKLFKLYNHITHNSELYYDDSSYFLILNTFKKADKKMRGFLSEYCEIIGGEETECSQIRENCSCVIAVNAIEEISKKAI